MTVKGEKAVNMSFAPHCLHWLRTSGPSTSSKPITKEKDIWLVSPIEFSTQFHRRENHEFFYCVMCSYDCTRLIS